MVFAGAVVERAMKMQEVILRALSGSLTWLQAADILDIDPRTVRRWRARFEANGPLGLYDRRRQPSRRHAPAPTTAPCAAASRRGACTTTGEPSATSAEAGARDSAGANARPSSRATSIVSVALPAVKTRHGGCTTSYSTVPPSRCRV